MTATIELPDVSGLSVPRAALAYVDAGIPIAPFDPRKGNGKQCGNLVGGDTAKWFERVTTDKAAIRAWRTRFGPFQALAASPGAIGAVVLDIDHPEKFPRQWRPLLETVPFVATRPSEHKRRGHYWFAMPVGHRSIGNPVHPWGEVRSIGGGIVLPPHPNDQRRIERFGAVPVIPTELLARIAGVPGVSHGEAFTLEAFCNRHTTQKYPGKLRGLVGLHARKLDQMNPHDAMRACLLAGLTEARCGFVPAKAVLSTLRAHWGRSSAEFQSLAKWCATEVEAMTTEELKIAETKSRRTAGSDSRQYAHLAR